MMNAKSQMAFSLIELLVSIAIVAIITGLSMAAYGKFTAKAQTTRCIEFVHQVRTALEQIYQGSDAWPPSLQAAAENGDGLLDEKAGAVLARGKMSLTYGLTDNDDGTSTYELKGHDRHGIVTPWAMDYITHHSSADKKSKLPGGGTIEDHILRFAIDLDYDGITEVAHGYDGGRARVRAQACVWSYGRDGKPNTKDDVRSWAKGQEVGR